ncbi:Transglycosylase SLT domain-containing protein [Fictibacillus enclensis]|uniref:Transglycosylase SLT domain-containing protein n=1 Tax=Fictibacillus enclensis TaxID=1017270 RepID=A0A0V8JCI1_9BACL|nr:lytic transglycosylase domain-containing protein [Fictibacillus enclensis]KSU84866.1 hypothetical protein AS030_04885 [Fictibacillus enclensis]SCB87056.1 Transglycosylase SLT domain-containing protein [Fictibacillus enclensis]
MEFNPIKMMLQLKVLKHISAAGIQSPFASSPFAMILEQLFEAAGIMPEQTTAGSQERLSVTNVSQQEQLPVKPTTAPLACKPHQDIHQLIDQISSKYNMNPALISSIVQHESGFNPMSKSPAGAMGLMQLMPETARSLGVRNPYHAEDNLEGGIKYIKQLLDMYHGDEKLALAAYNAGPGNVAKYRGIPPFKETQSYVAKVLHTYQALNA